ncbi:MAG: acetyltransferase [Campylobacterales bacterium]
MGTTELFIYGASGHGRVIADIAVACGYHIAGWIDDAPKEGALSWEQVTTSFPGAAIALGVGHNKMRQQLFKKVTAAGHPLPPLIHPSAIISPSVKVGDGTVIMPLSIINANARLGQGVIVNSGAIIEHDCFLGDFVHISPNAALAGGVTVGEGAHIGIGASLIQLVHIGAQTIVGAGSVVIHDLPSNVTAVGNPARIIKENP